MYFRGFFSFQLDFHRFLARVLTFLAENFPINSDMNSKMTELQSFIYKFHQLWSAGQSAHLDPDTHAGGAWVGLCVHLGHGHGPSNFQPQNKDSPSYSRHTAG